MNPRLRIRRPQLRPVQRVQMLKLMHRQEPRGIRRRARDSVDELVALRLAVAGDGVEIGEVEVLVEPVVVFVVGRGVLDVQDEGS